MWSLVALIPVLARLFGYDGGTVIAIVAIVAIISFLPAFVCTPSGPRAMPAGSGRVFRLFGAGGWVRFTRLVVPAAVPNWMIALRLAAEAWVRRRWG